MGQTERNMNAVNVERMVREHYSMVYRYVRSLVPAGEAAEDLVQEVFLVALGRPAGSEAPRREGPWLRGVARRLLLASHRSVPKELSVRMLEAADAAMDEGADREDARDALAVCLTRLPEEERRLLHYRYTEDLRSHQIAERVNRTREWVRVRLHRIRLILRECLRQHGVHA